LAASASLYTHLVPTRAPLTCPHCGYDLSGVNVESGACPECGRSFSRTALRTQSRSLHLLTITLVVYGDLGLLGAIVLSQCIAAMPAPTSGKVATAALYLSLIPSGIVACGVSILAVRTGRAVVSRGWPGALAIVFACSTLFACAAASAIATLGFGSDPKVSGMLQPSGWIQFNDWTHGPAQSLAIVAGAAVLRRVARSLDAHAAARSLAICALLGTLAAALQVASFFREVRPGVRTNSDYIIDSWIGILTAFFALSAGLGVAAAGIVVRRLWLGARAADDRPRPPEPNPPAAGQ
jgi:hypothetical protein